MRKKGIIASAMILTAAGIITRLLGFVYRIYMSNVIGAEGMGLYQLIMPIYSLAWSIACSGFTTTVSKLTAQEKAKGEHGNVSRILKICVVITSTAGIILGMIMFFGADSAAEILFRDARTVLPMRILAVAIPFMAAGSCLRGYFFGLREPVVPAVNQVLEQLIRMAVIYALAATLVPRGLEFACAAAVCGIVAEEVFSLLYIVIAFKRYKHKYPAYKPSSLTAFAALALILPMALPLTANRVVGSLLSAFENLLIPQRLQLFGYTQAQAISMFGRITGMAMPLIYFPSAFLISLSISLVPAVSESLAVGNHERIKTTAEKSMLFASVIGFIAAITFICFSAEFGFVIYKQDISEMLFLMGCMCPLLYMQVVLSGILNGLGYQMFLFRNSILSSVITISCVYFLVPLHGFPAFVMGWLASLALTCALELYKLNKSIGLSFDMANWLYKPLLAAAAAGLCVRYLAHYTLFDRYGYTVGLMIAVAIMILTYFIFLISAGCLTTDDIRGILKGGRNSGST